MSDFGKECGQVWRAIKKDFEEKPKTAAKQVAEQIIADMAKNIEQHEKAAPSKPWPVKPPAE